MSDTKKQFEQAFDEWAARYPGVFQLFDTSDGTLRSIAGYFYHQGASDAIEDARTIVNETATQFGVKK